MSKIVRVQVGQCGNQIGSKFWEDISKEHGLDASGVFQGTGEELTEGISSYFNEGSSGKYVARVVHVDLEPGVLNGIRDGTYTGLYAKESFVGAASGAGNNWAKGHYTEGAELIDAAMDEVRKNMEPCESVQAVEITHSLGGGTGSGMGTLLLSKIVEEYPDTLCNMYSVFPSPKVSDVVVEPYNALLSIHQLIENANVIFCYDNEALFDMAFRKLKIQQPRFVDLNQLISHSMSGISACLRFPGGNSDYNLNKLGDIPKLPAYVNPSFCKVVPSGYQKAANMIANTTSIRAVLDRIIQQFQPMFCKKAFLHRYTGEGMDEMEFTEAESNLVDICAEYAEQEAADNE